MTRSGARRVLLAVVWTALFALALRQLDRAIVGAPLPAGWHEARALGEIPRAAGHLALPSYLPSDLEWPPHTMRYRVGAQPGWWLGVHAAGDAAPALWLGAGGEPLPQVIAAGARCVYATAQARCDGAWHGLSRQMPDGQVVFVLTTLRPLDAARILKGLQPEESSARHRASR